MIKKIKDYFNKKEDTTLQAVKEVIEKKQDSISQLVRAKEMVQEYLYNLYEQRTSIEEQISNAKKAKEDLKNRIKRKTKENIINK